MAKCSFLLTKMAVLDILQKELAAEVGKNQPYIHNLLHGNIQCRNNKVWGPMVNMLCMTDSDKDRAYDEIAEINQDIPLDVQEILQGNKKLWDDIREQHRAKFLRMGYVSKWRLRHRLCNGWLSDDGYYHGKYIDVYKDAGLDVTDEKDVRLQKLLEAVFSIIDSVGVVYELEKME